MALSQKLSDLTIHEENNFVMVASIDFGTTFSGYAFSFKSTKEDIRINKNWGGETGHLSFKAPTSVLLDANGDMIAFGHEAESKYSQMIEQKGEQCCELYRQFKMTLYNQKHLTRSTKVCSVRGAIADAMVIMAHAVRYLKDHLLEAVAMSVASEPDPTLIRWIMTVPAIWSEESKRFMREVAFKAGITKNIDSRQFMICLEPEAASIYCRQLQTDQFTSGTRDDMQLLNKTGARYMVVDAGGGTIDITAHEIQPNGNVKELLAASGGDWGGTKVDYRFQCLLVQLLGKDFIARYRRECPSEWLEMRLNFEQKKKSVKPNDKSALIRLPLNWGIAGYYQEITGKNIQQVIQSTSMQGVRFHNGAITLDALIIKRLFDPVTAQVVDHVGKVLKSPKATGVRMILLVGGFGECAFVQDAIKRAFGQHLTIICPSDAGITIIKGAVLFGHTPDIIGTRIARKTYGTNTFDRFYPSIHPEQRKVTHERGDRVQVFRTFVKKGEEINTNEKRHFNFRASSSTQRAMRHRILCADTEIVKYPDEPTVRQIGQVEIAMPDTTGGINRRVQLTVCFGATELYIESKELKEDGTGAKAETRVDFLVD